VTFYLDPAGDVRAVKYLVQDIESSNVIGAVFDVLEVAKRLQVYASVTVRRPPGGFRPFRPSSLLALTCTNVLDGH